MLCTQLFSFCSLSLRCWCNCSIPSGPLSALQFTQERDVRSNGRQRTNNSKITPRFLSLVLRLKRHCQGEKKAAFFGQGDTSEDRIAPLRRAYQLLQTDFLTRRLPWGLELWPSWAFFLSHIFSEVSLVKHLEDSRTAALPERYQDSLRVKEQDKHMWKRCLNEKSIKRPSVAPP